MYTLSHTHIHTHYNVFFRTVHLAPPPPPNTLDKVCDLPPHSLTGHITLTHSAYVASYLSPCLPTLTLHTLTFHSHYSFTKFGVCMHNLLKASCYYLTLLHITLLHTTSHYTAASHFAHSSHCLTLRTFLTLPREREYSSCYTHYTSQSDPTHTASLHYTHCLATNTLPPCIPHTASRYTHCLTLNTLPHATHTEHTASH